MKEILVRYHNDNIDKIEELSKGDWIDLRAAETVELKAGDFKIISLIALFPPTYGIGLF